MFEKKRSLTSFWVRAVLEQHVVSSAGVGVALHYSSGNTSFKQLCVFCIIILVVFSPLSLRKLMSDHDSPEYLGLLMQIDLIHKHAISVHLLLFVLVSRVCLYHFFQSYTWCGCWHFTDDGGGSVTPLPFTVWGSHGAIVTSLCRFKQWLYNFPCGTMVNFPDNQVHCTIEDTLVEVLSGLDCDEGRAHQTLPRWKHRSSLLCHSMTSEICALLWRTLEPSSIAKEERQYKMWLDRSWECLDYSQQWTLSSSSVECAARVESGKRSWQLPHCSHTWSSPRCFNGTMYGGRPTMLPIKSIFNDPKGTARAEFPPAASSHFRCWSLCEKRWTNLRSMWPDHPSFRPPRLRAGFCLCPLTCPSIFRSNSCSYLLRLSLGSLEQIGLLHNCNRRSCNVRSRRTELTAPYHVSLTAPFHVCLCILLCLEDHAAAASKPAADRASNDVFALAHCLSSFAQCINFHGWRSGPSLVLHWRVLVCRQDSNFALVTQKIQACWTTPQKSPRLTWTWLSHPGFLGMSFYMTAITLSSWTRQRVPSLFEYSAYWRFFANPLSTSSMRSHWSGFCTCPRIVTLQLLEVGSYQL